MDVFSTLSAVFAQCVDRDFRLVDNPLCATLDAFARAFERRLLADRYDDRRIQNIAMLAAHPDGFSALVSLRGVEWAKVHVAKELGVDLRRVAHENTL